jgi:hypothetical protein
MTLFVRLDRSRDSKYQSCHADSRRPCKAGVGASCLGWKLACRSSLEQFQAVVNDFRSGRYTKKSEAKGKAFVKRSLMFARIYRTTTSDSDEACERVPHCPTIPWRIMLFFTMCNQAPPSARVFLVPKVISYRQIRFFRRGLAVDWP